MLRIVALAYDLLAIMIVVLTTNFLSAYDLLAKIALLTTFWRERKWQELLTTQTIN